MNPLPIFNQERPEINYDIMCPICHIEDMDENNSYAIKECNHKFHTDCIITWLRTNHSNCPMCNGFQDPERYNYSRHMRAFKLIMCFSRRKTAPKQLKKMVDKYKKLKEKSTLSSKNYNQFKKDHKTVLSEFRKLRMQKWISYRKIMKIKLEISSIPIEPLRISLMSAPKLLSSYGRSRRVSFMNN